MNLKSDRAQQTIDKVFLYSSFEEKAELEKRLSKTLSSEEKLVLTLDWMDFMAAISDKQEVATYGWIVLKFKNDQ
jgi:hypothetical protein